MKPNKQHMLGSDRTGRSGRAPRVYAIVTMVLSLSAVAPPVDAQAPASKKSANPEEKSVPSLAHEIRHQIQVLPFYSVFDHISFTLEGGKVTLTGQALRPTLKEHAEAAVKSLEGVTVVVDQIELLPASSGDDELRNAVYRVIYEDSGLQGYAVESVPPIHIIVKNGNVALEGVVESATDKRQAGMRASGVANARSVRNNLVVQSKGSAGE